jgi:predicted dehydrogenase
MFTEKPQFMTDTFRLPPVAEPRIAVIGCGYWGGNHARTLARLGALACVGDRNGERAEALAAEAGVSAATPDAILSDPAVHGVVLALPAEAHVEMGLKAIAAGKHLLVEKPIALNADDAARLVDAARQAGIIALTGHVLRYHPAFEALEALIGEGTLGTLRYIHSHRVGLGKFHDHFDALWDIAPHDLSLVMALTGAPPISVRGEGTAVLNHLSDFAHLHLGFASGLKSHVFVSRLSAYRERRLTVTGSKAMAVFDDAEPWPRKLALYRHSVALEADGRVEFRAADVEYLPVVEDFPLTRECAHYLACIRGEETARTPLSDGLDVIRVLEAGSGTHG